MTTATAILTPSQTSGLLRTALQVEFPEQVFRTIVRPHNYVGGRSIDVSWADGPTQNAVDLVVQKFAGSTFDRAQYLNKEYTGAVELDGRQIQMGVDAVFCRRFMSDTTREEIQAYVASETGHEFDSVGDYTHAPIREFDEGLPPLAIDSPHSVTGDHLVRQIFHLFTVLGNAGIEEETGR